MKGAHLMAIGIAVVALSCLVGGIFIGRGSVSCPPIPPPLQLDQRIGEEIGRLRADSARLADQTARLVSELEIERASTPPVQSRITHAYNRAVSMALDSVLHSMRADPPELD